MAIIIPQDATGTGGGGGGGTDDQVASEVPYSNTNSGLSGSNCQTAIDELARVAFIQDKSVITSYTLLPGDDLVIVNNTAPVTMTLPASPEEHKEYKIKDGNGNASSFNITIDGNGNLIDGLTTFVMSSDNQSTDLIFDGTKWLII